MGSVGQGSDPASTDIAVIGMAGRFPGASSVGEFYENLAGGVEGVRCFDDDELLSEGVSKGTLADPRYVKAGAVLANIDCFDASFFEINPREAALMDPQHRLFLECAWEALEDAACDPVRYEGAIGVYAGVSRSEYAGRFRGDPNADELQIELTNGKDFLATKVSYRLNLRGPSLSVQTACSTSLVATHLACRALSGGECSIALAGGSSISVPQRVGYFHDGGGMFSPDGHCRPFDAGAQGTLRGSGVAIVVLKRLADALDDGDSIRAIIKGSAINNDGARKGTYTAPSIEGQAEAIAAALAYAKIDPQTIDFIEAHGTATPVGDPVEMAALARVFDMAGAVPKACAIGSVKSNVGHLDAAAGATGLIKAILALENRVLIPSLHFSHSNPRVDRYMTSFFVPTTAEPWDRDSTPRRAGVSAFGIGGTNAHVVLEEAPDRHPATPPRRSAHLVTLSAKSEAALRRRRDQLVEHLTKGTDVALADVCYTLQMGRSELPHRLAAVARDRASLVRILKDEEDNGVVKGLADGTAPGVNFLFPGHGPQYAGMSHSLYKTEPHFASHVDRCAERLMPVLGKDIRTSLFPEALEHLPVAGHIDDMAIGLPALFVVEYALAQLWRHWGVQPTAMLGNSMGEYAAATLAGVLSLDDALRIVAVRGQLFSGLPRGAMLVVALAEADVLRQLGEELSLAAVSGPSTCVVAGPPHAIERFARELILKGVDTQRVRSTRAAHSSMVESILPAFRSELDRITLHAPTELYVSSLTGDWITVQEATDPDYWVQHLRQTMRIADGIRLLAAEREPVLFLEVGPGRMLSSLVRQQSGKLAVRSMRHPREELGDDVYLLEALARLWCAGIPIEWSAFNDHDRRQRVSLPTYPFEPVRHWTTGRGPQEPAKSLATTDRSARTVDVRRDVTDWFYVPSWRCVPLIGGQDRESASRSWLIFRDDAGVGTHLSAGLQQVGDTVILVERGAVGSTFRCEIDEGRGCCSIDATDESHYDQLLEALAQNGAEPNGIVHCWTVGKGCAPFEEARQSYEEAQEDGAYSLLYLTQALGRCCAGRPMELWVLSSGVHDITGNEELHPAKATVLGVCRIVSQEYRDITGYHIDLPGGAAATFGDFSEPLLAEVRSGATVQTIAYRGSHRWIREYEPIKLEPKVARAATIRKNGIYVITGGLGHIGSILARHLASSANARLALTTRSWLPQIETWDTWLAEHDEDGAISARIRTVRLLESLGAQVLVYSADVSDRNRMRSVVNDICHRWGEPNGIIHAAGIIAPETFTGVRETSVHDLQLHAKPKVHGAYVLAELTQDIRMDFCLLMSSLSCILGGLRYLAYTSANLFLDTFAHRQNRLNGTCWMSVNWDAWENVQGWGHAAQHALNHLSIRPEEGVEAFRRILGSGLPQVAVSTYRLDRRIANPLRVPVGVVPTEVDLVTVGARPTQSQDGEQATGSTGIEQIVARAWQDVLGIEHVDLHDDFLDLGGDSFMGIQVLSRLRREFQVDISVDTIFTAPTVAQFASVIEGLLSEVGSTTEDALGSE